MPLGKQLTGPCEMEIMSINSSLSFVCSSDSQAVHSSGWVLLPVSLCSMRGIPRASPQDKTARTTITAQSWHRRGEDCFQPPQPASVGRNDRYNWASGFFLHLYVWGRTSVAVLSHSVELKLKIWSGGGVSKRKAFNCHGKKHV